MESKFCKSTFVSEVLISYDSLPSYYRQLKEYHLQHHFADHQNGFGVTSRLWDRVFGTELQMPASRRLKTK
jgi:4-hydroxysphinganine ceramide fatty acyl 2-hydroxylase